jgi:hypothetical protein
MGKSDSWSLIMNWPLLMLAVTQAESLPSTHAPTPPHLLLHHLFLITLHTLTLKLVGKTKVSPVIEKNKYRKCFASTVFIEDTSPRKFVLL